MAESTIGAHGLQILVPAKEHRDDEWKRREATPLGQGP